MRTLVDIDQAQVEALDVMAKRERRSRAALIRAAIDDYLLRRRCEQVGDGFGLWRERQIDGLAYQQKARAEW
jgi:metal-responsive CopG/Arc/MetJ family transcriptional regulator